MKTKEQLRIEFEELSKPLIKFLNDNYHPHTDIFIDTERARLSEGLIGFTTDKFFKD